RPVFVMNVPATWQTVAAQVLYRDELRRLLRFCHRLGGTPPDEQRLAEVVLDFDTRRARLRGLEGQTSPRRFAEALARFAHTGEIEHVDQCTRTPQDGRVPVALVGGPLRHDELKLFDRIERLGGTVALDGTETGLRCLAAPVDRRAVAEDPLEQVAQAYLDGIVDPYQRPNSRFFRWLDKQLTTRGLRGVIVYRYVWCDRWAAELRRLHDWSPVPVLALDQDETTEPTGRGDTRLEAFMELIGHTR
ncbi:MAG: 2-hydroxyacyl-CoA dehydratase, partial [Planctomycetota bacterium]